jgi:S1-C subfamily serine protease
MRRRRVGRSIAVVALLVSALTGCGDVVERLARKATTSTSAETPQPAPDHDAAVARTKPSVNSCSKILEGTGFVIAPSKVLTSAHVVAGGQTVTIDVDGAAFDAQVVSYDPNADIAIIDVPGLPAPPLNLASFPVATGAEALMLGYPNGGSFAAVHARVRDMVDLNGPDIYRARKVTRQVYIVTIVGRESLRGVSGGPLIDMTGRVLGVVFAAQVQDPHTGFALTTDEIAPQMAAIGKTEAAATGDCVS